MLPSALLAARVGADFARLSLIARGVLSLFPAAVEDSQSSEELTIRPKNRLRRFFRAVVVETPFVKMLIVLVVLWMMFSTAMYLVEHSAEGTSIRTATDALYWGVAALSTAGIADTPHTSAGKIIGGVWIIIGSVIFFGTIVASITIYFMRPLQRPVRSSDSNWRWRLTIPNATAKSSRLQPSVQYLANHPE